MMEDMVQEQVAKGNDEDERVILNVGGKKFEVSRRTLTRYPHTLLGSMYAAFGLQFSTEKRYFSALISTQFLLKYSFEDLILVIPIKFDLTREENISLTEIQSSLK